MTTVSIHYCFPEFSFLNHWETFDTSDTAHVIKDAENDAFIDMYVINGKLKEKKKAAA